MLTWVCVYPAKETTTKRQKLNHVLFTATIIATEIIFLLSSAAFIYVNASESLKIIIYAMAEIVGIVTNMYPLLVLYLLRHDLVEMFQCVSNIFNECNIIKNFISFFTNNFFKF